jgi:uncharacterized protein with ATP-grasp and redox domains
MQQQLDRISFFMDIPVIKNTPKIPMKIWPDCIPCILNMTLKAARLTLKDEEQARTFMKEVLTFDYFNGTDWSMTSPEVIKHIWMKLIETSGKPDPMKEIKEAQNRKALDIYSIARELVFKSREPLLDAIKLAIAGNAIDAMKDIRGEMPEKILEKWQQVEVDHHALHRFKERLKGSQKIAYLGDNCGEIVFDRILIEVLNELYRPGIFFITRTVPIMNDALLEDAISLGIDKIAKVMENGLPEPFPGTDLKMIHPEIKTLIGTSDLVISKGGGNYDSLTEEETLRGKVSFLFLAKCHPYCSIHQVSLGSPILYHF